MHPFPIATVFRRSLQLARRGKTAASSELLIIRTAPTHFPEEPAESVDRTTEKRISNLSPLAQRITVYESTLYFMGGNVTNLRVTPAWEYGTLQPSTQGTDLPGLTASAKMFLVGSTQPRYVGLVAACSQLDSYIARVDLCS